MSETVKNKHVPEETAEELFEKEKSYRTGF